MSSDGRLLRLGLRAFFRSLAVCRLVCLDVFFECRVKAAVVSISGSSSCILVYFADCFFEKLTYARSPLVVEELSWGCGKTGKSGVL